MDLNLNKVESKQVSFIGDEQYTDSVVDYSEHN